MNAVIDRLVQYPNRFQLTNISDGTVLGTFDLSPVTGTVSVVGTILNHDLFQSIADDLASRIKTEGGVVSNTIETFTMAGTRTNISSGETISVSFGKIAKIINDLKEVAFSGNKSDIGLGNVENTSDLAKPVSTATKTALDNKVDKVSGSSLMTDAEHNKLSGIADGAEVNVNADWNATSGDAVILNKPTIPNVPVQSVNSKTGAVVLTGSDIATSSADSEKLDSKSVANMLHLGAYDTYTYDSTTGIYTVKRKTGYANISSSLYQHGFYRGTINGHGEYGADTGIGPITNNDNFIFINNLLTIKTVIEVYNGEIGIALLSQGGCWINLGDNYTSNEQYREYLATNNIYIQYKLATPTTERVEKNHFARYNERFILEHNKQEAERSSNLTKVNSSSGVSSVILSSSLQSGQYTLSLSCGTDDAFTILSGSTAIGTHTAGTASFSLTFTISSVSSISISGTAGSYAYSNIMLNRGTVSLPYQPYEGEVVHGKLLAETLSAYPTSQSVSETYLSKADASSTYVAKSSLTSVPTENSTNPITSGGVYEGLAKKLDKGDWREYQFTYVKDTYIIIDISPALENGTYICQILARGTGDYSGIVTCYSLGVFSVLDFHGGSVYVSTGVNIGNSTTYNLSAIIKGTSVSVRGDLENLQDGTYTSFTRFRKIADD